MRKLDFVALALLLVVSQRPAWNAEQTPAARSETSTQAKSTDTRLNQKITYEGGYKRLHEVTDELSKQTGVIIRCGKDNKDWQVRDLPLVVCIRDMPLGKLLRMLALTSHTQFTSSKPPNQPENKRTYNLSRSQAMEKDLSGWLARRRDAALAMADWSWDALVSLGSSPESVGGTTESRLVGKILACLEPSAKNKVLAGEPVSIYRDEFPQPSLLQDLAEWNIQDMQSKVTGNMYWVSGKHAAFRIEIGLEDAAGVEGRTGVKFELQAGYMRRLEQIARPLAKIAELRLAQLPEEEASPALRDEMPEKTLTFLNIDEDRAWRNGFLGSKVSLKPREGQKERSFADLIHALSAAGGFDVICEDFTSQKTKGHVAPASTSVERVSIGTTLRSASSGNTNWFIQSNSNLLVGWSEGWRERHMALVPADYLADLRRKLNGDGVDVDDISCFANMTESQLREWIRGTQDFSVLWPVSFEYQWRLYDSLTPEEKSRAKSDEGMPLAEFEPEELAAFCRQARFPRKTMVFLSDEAGRRIESDQDRRDRVLSDPKSVSALVMRVRSELGGLPSLMSQMFENVNGKPAPARIGNRSYHLEFEGKDEERVFVFDVSGPGVCFPIYSPQREAQLLKEKSAAEAK